MKIVNPEATAALLPYPELAREIGATLKDWASGRVQVLERAMAPVGEGGTFFMMGAADDRLAIAKIGAVHSANVQKGLPTIIASVLITDARTGEVISLIDGTTVTVRRTAALSLYGAGQVGANARQTLLFGAGAQALGHVEALAAGLGLQELYVTSRTAAKAEQLAEQARRLGVEAQVVSAEQAAALAETVELIVTTTNSPTPVLTAGLASKLKPTTTIVAVGAFRPDMAEIAAAVVGACDVVVDTLTGAKDEAGDLIQAAAEGAFSWEAASSLADVRDGFIRGDRPVLYKTTGHAIWDLAAARLAVPR